MGGAEYTYALNEFYPTEVSAVFNKNGQHGKRLSIDGTQTDMPDQNVSHQYDEASHLVAILDNALPLTTLFRYSPAGYRARETFIAGDGHIHQAVVMKRNALGWLTEVQDTIMQVKFGYDAKGNKRFTKASVYWDDQWQAIDGENWYTYTDADNMVINRGRLFREDGKIDIAPDKGTMLLYDVASHANMK